MRNLFVAAALCTFVGIVVFAGQTPIKALGTTDQHSQVQLYVEGPRDKVVTFWAVEKPPRPTAEKAWHRASNQDMPHSLSATAPAAVSSAYTIHRFFAVSVMRGARRSSFTPGACPL